MSLRIPPRVKICCISSVEEAQLALAAGADALGLVSHMPSGPGVISESVIAAILDWLPPGCRSFLLTSLVAAADIAAQHARCPTTTLQLCDRLDSAAHARLRTLLPETELVQVIHVRNEGSVAEARAAAERVDALLLDSGAPDARTPELGGTGRVHDWNLSRRICEGVDIPVYLAGGLNPENVASAIARVQPHAVDVCSGVRRDDRLDQDELARFMAAVRRRD